LCQSALDRDPVSAPKIDPSGDELVETSPCCPGTSEPALKQGLQAQAAAWDSSQISKILPLGNNLELFARS